MKCPQCQHENPASVGFCGECGARLEAVCGACGAGNPPTNKFCHGCGQALARGPVTPRFTSPEIYTPRHLAEKILTSRSALEGERKQVTVLFADMKGSMELLADRDPEEARRLLDPVLERMMEAVHRYEGTVNQVMGDGIMALFGAPLAHEDHGVRACYAALRMQEAVKRYAESLGGAEGLSIRIRVGLNSGEVVVRSIGNDLRMDYSAVGQTTHLAARMEQLATPGSILITASTLRLSTGYVDVKPLGLVKAKGLSEPIEVFEVAGAGPVRTRLQALTTRIPTRVVGREVELETLKKVGARVHGGHGEVVALVGEPGVGKSRLVWEFARSLRSQGWRVLESSAASYTKAIPYLSVIELLRAYFQVEAGDDVRMVGEKVRNTVLALDSTLHQVLAPVCALLEVPVEDSQWQRLDALHRRQRTLDAIKRLLLRDSQVQPLCLIFDDLHWVDSETQAFLDTLVGGLSGARLLLLVNYRPEYRHSWGSHSYYRRLRIDPLPAESAAELLDGLVGRDRSLGALKRLLVERTQGNPFFLEESVQTLVETRVLLGERGAYRLARPLQGIQVPDTVQTVLAARIDRLPPEDKRLLQAASVIGETVPFGLLEAVAELSDEELHRGLSRLQAAEFLYETSLFPNAEFAFKHGLTHQVAYSAMLHEQQRILHARIVGVMERLYRDRLGEQVDRLAYHAFRGELWPEAVRFLRQAGLRSVARSASREAVADFERALAALGHLPQTAETLAIAFDLRFDLQGACVPLGDLERMRIHLGEAERLAEAMDDQPRLGRVLAAMAHGSWWSGEPDRAVESARRAEGIATSFGDPELEILANIRLAQASFALGEYRPTIDACRACVDSLKGDLIRESVGLSAIPAVVSLTFMGRSLAVLGEFVAAVATTGDAMQVAELAHHPYSVVLACWAHGDVSLFQGELVRAMAALERAQSLCEEQGFALMAPIVARTLGEAYALEGRHQPALALLQRAVDELAAMNYMPTLPSAYAGLSEALLLAGRLAEARRCGERARELCRVHRQRGNEAYVLRVLGDIHAAGDPPEISEAEAAYREARALADAIGSRPLAARATLGLGKLFRKAGDRPRAEAHLGDALAALRQLQMRLWLAEAEAEWAALRGATAPA
jgi:class 3 adenylate cyclase/tetratricopeptide (TPR) repeat protein